MTSSKELDRELWKRTLTCAAGLHMYTHVTAHDTQIHTFTLLNPSYTFPKIKIKVNFLFFEVQGHRNKIEATYMECIKSICDFFVCKHRTVLKEKFVNFL